jgi:post-segregation antitoxin (ccd killing protein)
MGEQTTVCAKVPAELKQKLAKLGINISELIRQQLQEEVNRIEKEQLTKKAHEISTILKKIPPEEFTQSIRATRENR